MYINKLQFLGVKVKKKLIHRRYKALAEVEKAGLIKR